ncbi:MAG: DUF2273 domain-containing protein [Clostridiales bacterium]|nr:DUF2273 domain-containing protein [Clostridiales bacterium]
MKWVDVSNSAKLLKPYLWRIIFTIIGLLVAVSFLLIGFFKTILVLLCCAIGYLVGLAHDKGASIIKYIKQVRGKW